MRRLLLVIPLLLAPVACSDDDDASDQVVGSPSGSASGSASGSVDEAEPSTSSSTSTSSTTTTAPFEGSTAPTSIPSTATGVALLEDVEVTETTVTFTFRDGVVPGVDAAYVDEVAMDGSGEPVQVAGEEHLQVRMEPASGVDLSSSSGTFEETYTGPTRFEASGPIVEVIRTGDFEANLTWVIGVADERAYRIDVSGSTVVVSVAP